MKIKKSELQGLFTARLCKTYGLRCATRKRSEANLYPDELLWTNDQDNNEPPRIIVEYKKPEVNLVLREHVDQISAHAMAILINKPDLSHMLLLVTNGWEYLAGHIYRNDHCTQFFEFVSEVRSLYDRYTRMDAGYKLKFVSRETGHLCLEEFRFFNTMILTAMNSRPLCTSFSALSPDNQLIEFSIGKMVGIGGSSCIYECLGERFKNSPAVVKFSSDRVSFDREVTVYNNLRFEGLKMYGCNRNMLFLILEHARSVHSSINSVEDHKELTTDNFIQLLENLKALHELGFVHRDIRLSNVFIKGNGKAVLGDFGAATKVNTPIPFSGGRETASQRVLAHLFSKDKNEEFSYSFADDYESFLKLLLTYDLNLEDSLARNRKPAHLFNFWRHNIKACIQGSDLETPEAWRLYLLRMLASPDLVHKPHKLLISGLPVSVDNAWLHQQLSNLGGFMKAEVNCDDYGHSKGTGFILFQSYTLAQEAKILIDRKVFDGLKINASVAEI